MVIFREERTEEEVIASKTDILNSAIKNNVRMVAVFLLGIILLGGNIPTAIYVSATLLIINITWLFQIVGKWSRASTTWMGWVLGTILALHAVLFAVPVTAIGYLSINMANPPFPWYDEATMFLGFLVLWMASLFFLPGMMERLDREAHISG